MALLARLMERRGSIENPNTSLASPALWLHEALGGGSSSYTGKSITEENAVESSAVFACVRVITEDFATLPVGLREKTDEGNAPRTDHRVHRLLAEQPNPEMTPPVFWEAVQVNVELWGNGYAEIERNGAGEPIGLWPIQAKRVTPMRIRGRRVYKVTLPDGEDVFLPAENVLHVPGMGWDGMQGFSPIRMLRQSVGLALATEEYGARWFGDGARAPGVIQGPKNMSDDAYARLLSSWDKMHKGLSNAHRTAILEEGFTYQQVGIAPEDSQFLETRKFQTEEIARAFRVPLVLIGHTEKATSWGTGIEQFMRGYVTHTLRPKIVRWESELNTKLLRTEERGRLYTHFRVEGLLRGDLKSRYDAYQIGRQNGWLNGNDIRRLEDMNPEEGLDEYLINGNMVPVAQAGQLFGPRGLAPEDEGRTREVRAIETRRRRSLTNRRRIQRDSLPLFEEAASRFVRREVEAGKAAVRKLLGQRNLTDFDRWVQEFYDEHRDYIRQSMAGTFSAYARLVYAEAAEEAAGSATFSAAAREAVEEFLEVMAAKQVDYSVGQLRNLVQGVGDGDISGDLDEVLIQRMDEWLDSRPGKVALRESVTLNGRMSERAYMDNQVVRKRWAAFGQSCPLCSEMDGRVVGVSAPFLQPGDQVRPRGSAAPLEVRHAIRHPQLHGGCDCGIISD